MPHLETVFRRSALRLPGYLAARLWHGWWRFWIGMQQAVLFRRPRADAKDVAVYAIGSIGDFMHALPALGAIRQSHPDANITLITNANEGDPWPMRLGIDTALDAAIASYANPAALREAVSGTDALYYLAPFPLRGMRSLRDMLFFALAGVRQARGFTALAPRGWVARALRPWRTQPPQYQHLLAACGLEDGRRPDLPTEAQDTPPAPYVVLAPTGKYSAQHWPEERFIEIAKRLETAGVQPVWVGLPTDAERVAAAGEAPGKRAFGELAFPALRALIANAGAVLSNDSGLAHIAGYAGTPVVVVSSARDAAYAWRPPSGNSPATLLRKDMNCEACSLRVCSDNACLNAISVDEAWGALQALLRRR